MDVPVLGLVHLRHIQVESTAVLVPRLEVGDAGLAPRADAIIDDFGAAVRNAAVRAVLGGPGRVINGSVLVELPWLACCAPRGPGNRQGNRKRIRLL